MKLEVKQFSRYVDLASRFVGNRNLWIYLGKGNLFSTNGFSGFISEGFDEIDFDPVLVSSSLIQSLCQKVDDRKELVINFLENDKKVLFKWGSLKVKLSSSTPELDIPSRPKKDRYVELSLDEVDVFKEAILMGLKFTSDKIDPEEIRGICVEKNLAYATDRFTEIRYDLKFEPFKCPDRIMIPLFFLKEIVQIMETEKLKGVYFDKAKSKVWFKFNRFVCFCCLYTKPTLDMEAPFRKLNPMLQDSGTSSFNFKADGLFVEKVRRLSFPDSQEMDLHSDGKEFVSFHVGGQHGSIKEKYTVGSFSKEVSFRVDYQKFLVSLETFSSSEIVFVDNRILVFFSEKHPQITSFLVCLNKNTKE